MLLFFFLILLKIAIKTNKIAVCIDENTVPVCSWGINTNCSLLLEINYFNLQNLLFANEAIV